MELHQRLADGKTEAQAGGGIPRSLLEWIKNAAELLWLNACPRVVHFDVEPAFGVSRSDEDLSLIGSEFYGVAYEVPENLTQ